MQISTIVSLSSAYKLMRAAIEWNWLEDAPRRYLQHSTNFDVKMGMGMGMEAAVADLN